ncbi:hypothetical protein PIROE2DRAFT_10359 [Piromyces sp. E2]|nr:hypothetical protein PIROE2DRAFT_10359 [Piromyces sp. E2]|eukprot:OUM63144.1 hypothetical protein PIROE2DRAFT_10359 [Piromyces sp. E2]
MNSFTVHRGLPAPYIDDLTAFLTKPIPIINISMNCKAVYSNVFVKTPNVIMIANVVSIWYTG